MLAPCRLYVNVITTIRSFGDYFWVDVVEQIDAMTEQVSSKLVCSRQSPWCCCWQAGLEGKCPCHVLLRSKASDLHTSL